MHRRILPRTCALLLLLPTAPGLQNGDHEGEEQPPLDERIIVPPAPVLSPAEELAGFRLPPGLTIELVCAEPLVEDPVACSFDEDGRLWVVEMRGYMPDADGTGELAPIGNVVVLSDTDADGTHDERTVFLDELVLPRAVAPMRGGALVILPPDLVFCEDTDGDGRADERTVVATGMGGLDNPEHAINGLMPTLDNWYRCANDSRRWRYYRDEWIEERVVGGGQWGITKDDLGRVFHNTNSALLRGDLYPSRYLVRNPNHGPASGGNVGILGQARPLSPRVNTGVNRGYQKGVLTEDGYLNQITAACGPLVYRGDALPEEFRGDAFVCEPAANLVKRLEFYDDDKGRLRARSVHDKYDFLTALDERFRPVNLIDGPDGALYVVDFYRGAFQHRIYMTSFLRKQVDERGLAAPAGLGRIWRIRPTEWKRPAPPKLSAASWTQLTEELAHANGWRRDTAQRLIVEEGRYSADAQELTRNVATDAPSALARMHAIWTLEGIGGIDLELLRVLFKDEDPRVLHAAVRASERLLASGDVKLLGALVRLAGRADEKLRHQITLSLGEARTDVGGRALARMLIVDASTPDARSAVISGLYQRELEFLQRMLVMKSLVEKQAGRDVAVRLIAKCIATEGRSEGIEGVLDLLVLERPLPDWHRAELVGGLLAGRPPGPDGKPSYLHVRRKPAAFDELARREDEKTAELLAALAWPGREGLDIVPVEPLTPQEQLHFDAGRAIYQSICAACHQSSGLGEGGKAPPLRFSEWVLGEPDTLIKIATHGMRGPVEVRGKTWDLEMPAFVASDEDIASVLTYIRREWGHGVSAIAPDDVTRVRAAVGKRGPWTAEELK